MAAAGAVRGEGSGDWGRGRERHQRLSGLQGSGKTLVFILCETGSPWTPGSRKGGILT